MYLRQYAPDPYTEKAPDPGDYYHMNIMLL
jgi:hypothetical protein